MGTRRDFHKAIITMTPSVAPAVQAKLEFTSLQAMRITAVIIFSANCLQLKNCRRIRITYSPKNTTRWVFRERNTLCFSKFFRTILQYLLYNSYCNKNSIALALA